MSRWSLVSVLAALALAAGCGQPARAPATAVNAATVDGLCVSLEIPCRSYVCGQSFPAVVTARNLCDQPICIEAATGAPVYIDLWRNTGTVWERVKTYPQAAPMVLAPWRLEAGAAREFRLCLKVEPDWPTNELLKLTARLDGRPQPQPNIFIAVQPAK